MNEITVVIPTFHSYALVKTCIKSFERFRPANLHIKFVVVENSNDDSYKNDVIKLANDVQWVQNEISFVGSEANASGLVKGLEFVRTKYVLLVHCDICITSTTFFKHIFDMFAQGNVLVGTVLDPSRINAIHVSCLATLTTIAQSVDLYPQYINGQQIMDVGDSLTQHCRKNDLKHICFSNTFNNNVLDIIDDSFVKFHVDRCVVGGEVIMMHLGRGVPKTLGTYEKPNRVLLDEWTLFCEKFI